MIRGMKRITLSCCDWRNCGQLRENWRGT